MLADEPPLKERVRALAAMVAHGVDEQTVTLTYIDGIGGTLARRLHEAGVIDIEELAHGRVRGAREASRGVREAGGAVDRGSHRDDPQPVGVLVPRDGCEDRDRSRDPGIPAWILTGCDGHWILRFRRRQTGLRSAGASSRIESMVVATTLACDCADFAKGRACKHVLAVRLHSKDAELVLLVERLSAEAGDASGLDLFQLWFDGGKR